MTFDEKQIAHTMKSLGIDRAEAIQMLKDDYEVDHMSASEVDNDLTAEQKKVVKTMKNSDTKKPTAYKFTKRERKKDEVKAGLISAIAEFLGDKVENLEITKAEREIVFEVKNEHFTINLIKNRTKKEG
jgi:hypothetical protein